jgi:hypothetical protein
MMRRKSLVDTPVDTRRLTDVDDDRGCRWLEGNATARQFCAAPVSAIGSSWCDFHFRLVFNGAPK